MSWYQQNMGFIVVGLIVLLGILGVYIRLRVRAHQNKLIEQGKTRTFEPPAFTAGSSSDTGLATMLSFSAPLERVRDTLADHKSTGGWKAVAAGSWHFPSGGKVKGTVSTAAELQAAGPDTAQLVLLRSGDAGGVPLVGRAWQEFRAQISSAVAAQGIHADELQGPELVRTQAGAKDGLSPLEQSLQPHVWLRPGHQL